MADDGDDDLAVAATIVLSALSWLQKVSGLFQNFPGPQKHFSRTVS